MVSNLALNLYRFTNGDPDLLLSQSTLHLSQFFHPEWSGSSAVHCDLKFLLTSTFTFLSRFLPSNHYTHNPFIIDLHMHLFTCVGGYICDTAAQNTDALSTSTGTAPGCSDWIYSDSDIYSASELAMGFLYVGCYCGSTYNSGISYDQREIL